MRIRSALLAVAAVLTVAPAPLVAHFKLVEPASWIVESERRSPEVGALRRHPNAKMSSAVTKVTGGSLLHLKVVETIYHPGHYRVALAVNSREELPPDPKTNNRSPKRGRTRYGASSKARPSFR